MRTRFNYYQDGRTMAFATSGFEPMQRAGWPKDLGPAAAAGAALVVDVDCDGAGNVIVLVGELSESEASQVFATATGGLEVDERGLFFLNGPMEGGDTVSIAVPPGRYRADLRALPGATIHDHLLLRALPKSPIAWWEAHRTGEPMPWWLLIAASSDPESWDPGREDRWDGELADQVEEAEDVSDSAEGPDGPVGWILQLRHTDELPPPPPHGVHRIWDSIRRLDHVPRGL